MIILNNPSFESSGVSESRNGLIFEVHKISTTLFQIFVVFVFKLTDSDSHFRGFNSFDIPQIVF